MRTRRLVLPAALVLACTILTALLCLERNERLVLEARVTAQDTAARTLQTNINTVQSKAGDARIIAQSFANAEGRLGQLETFQQSATTQLNLQNKQLDESIRSEAAARVSSADALRAELTAVKQDLASARDQLARTRTELADARAKSDRKTVDAQSFNLIDAEGQPLASLSANDNGPALVFFDRQHREVERLRLGTLDSAANCGLVLKSDTNRPLASLALNRDQPQLSLAQNKASGAHLNLTVEGRNPRLELSPNDTRKSLVLGLDSDDAYADLYTAAGAKCVSLSASREAWGVTLMDDTTRAGLLMNIVAHKPVLSTLDHTGRSDWSAAAQKDDQSATLNH